ncbi:MAG: holin family protein [Tagaea sp.]|nr:holin family protein [Tagaea sp.]
MLAAILPVLGPILGQVAKSIFPNAEDELRRIEMQNQLQLALMNNAVSLEQAAAGIVKAEAESEHWLTANWRPILMLVFAGLIVARWFGLTAPGITEAVELKLWGILEIGIGGYVIGRSAEKIAPAIADALKRR